MAHRSLTQGNSGSAHDAEGKRVIPKVIVGTMRVRIPSAPLILCLFALIVVGCGRSTRESVRMRLGDPGL